MVFADPAFPEIHARRQAIELNTFTREFIFE